MIQNYRIPVNKGKVSQGEYLHLSDDADLKDALYSKRIQTAKVLSFKNANIKDQTLQLMEQLKTPPTIMHLDLSQNFSFITDQSVEILVGLPCFKQLKVLNLADNQITDDSMVVLSKASSMHHLQELVLYGNSDITGAGLVLLAHSPFLKHIKALDLHATSVDDEGMHELMKSENCQDLEKINLSMSWKMITSKTLYSIANSKSCKKLQVLLLEDCKVSDQGIDELSESENAGSLTHLSLNNSAKHSSNTITDQTLSSIGLSKSMVNLKILELRNTEITAKGLKQLAVSMAAESIETLRLSHCKKIEVEVFPYLQKIVSLQNLKKLYLNDCKLDRQDLHTFEMKNPTLNLIY